MDSNKVCPLEQSTQECSSTESSLNTESGASSRPNILPSILRLDLATNQSPTESNNSPSTRLLNGSHPNYSAIGVPANGQPIGSEENEQIPRESLINRCCTFLNWYKNKVIEFRDSCHVHILHLIFSYIAIASIIVGSIYTNECPLASYLPILAIVVGVVGLVFMGFASAVNCQEHFATPCSRRLKCALGILFALLLLLVISEIVIIAHLSPNFHAFAEDYCHETFYYYIIGKETMSVAAIIISVLIYFPGSSLHTFCQNCAMPLPASAFFSRL